MREIERHRTTLVFCNTRSLAELIFQDLWAVNDDESADRHPSRLAVDRGAAQGRGGGGVGAAARRWSAPPASISASTGATSTSSSRWARPRARRGCCSGSAAPTTGSTSRREAILVPGNRFEYLEARAALDAIDEGELDAETVPPRRARRARPAYHGAAPAPRRSTRRRCSTRCARAAPYAGLDGGAVRPGARASSRAAAMRCAPMTSSSG